MIDLREITEPSDKANICRTILGALPLWFGIESATQAYVNESAAMPFCAAYDGERPVGFVAMLEHNAATAEVYVMGILPHYHRMGIGGRLIGWCEDSCAAAGREYLTVKTLDEARENAEYARTRRFYLGVGFKPLEVFPLLWGEANPCLMLVKHIPTR